MSVKIRKEWFEDGGLLRNSLYVSEGGIRMNLKEKVIKCLGYCFDPHGDDCYRCLYYDKEWDSFNGPDLANDIITLIKAYDFALGQYKETLDELIENNDGDVKEICVFLLNLLRIKEVDIKKGFYIEKLVNEEMMRIDDEQVKNMAHDLWVMYSSFVHEGFTKQQAMSLIKTMLSPRVGGVNS